MLEPLLGYKSTWRVLSLIAETPRKEINTTTIRKETKLGNQAIEETLRRLVKANILIEHKGKPSLYRLNLEHPYTQHLLPLFETERRALRHLDYPIRTALAELLRNVINQDDFSAVYLFGSHAKGYAREESDIDIALIYNKQPNELEISELQEKTKKLGNTQIHTFTTEEFKKSTPMTEQIKKEGINLLILMPQEK
jgi:predicted nucleotidyltransferase